MVLLLLLLPKLLNGLKEKGTKLEPSNPEEVDPEAAADAVVLPPAVATTVDLLAVANGR